MKVLITAPLRQEKKIFVEFQESLDRLRVPDGVEVDRFFVVNDDPGIIPEIHGADYIEMNTRDRYRKNEQTHIWTADNLNKMPQLRNATIQRALDGGYDYWWSVDTDLVLHPDTLAYLLEADKDIVSEIFWTKTSGGGWWVNAWMYDQCDFDGQLKAWATPGLYQVGMTGACTLVKRKVLEAGVNYSAIPNIRKVLFGEDRWFCIRAACHGFELWVDTHCPAEHLYRNSEYIKYMRSKKHGNDR